jgi:hypothetical protein
MRLEKIQWDGLLLSGFYTVSLTRVPLAAQRGSPGLLEHHTANGDGASLVTADV